MRQEREEGVRKREEKREYEGERERDSKTKR